MKASLRIVALGLLLLVPCASAYAQAPSLSIIPNVTVNAGETKTVSVVAVDPAGRDITLTSALPSFATLNTPTFGTGVVVTTVTVAPSAVHVSTTPYTVAVTASAGGVADIEIFQITVNAAGSDHVPDVTAPALQTVTEGSNLNFTVTVSDADGDEIEGFMAMQLPSGATFTPSSGSSGVFNWTPGLSAAGEYDVVFSAMAMNGPIGRAVTHIRVANAQELAITPINDVSVETGSSISVPVIALGPPGQLITLAASLPSFATLLAPGTGTGNVTTTISVAPPQGSAGTYHASVTASANGATVTELFDIIVTGTGGGENDAPVLSAPSSETVDAGSSLTFDVTATDPDGDHVSLFGSGMPPGSTFLDHANNTGTFTWNTTASQGGTYTASFSGLDGRGGSGSASTQITVVGAPVENHPPTLTAPLTQQVAEGANLSFTVTATDQDGDHVALSGTVPSGASFTDQGNNSGVFSWTPNSTQSGVHTAAFSGDDGNGGTGTASTTITVTDVVENHPPTLSAPATEQVAEGANLSFTVTATDQDGDHVALSATVPSGASFTDQGNNSGVFSWTPGSTQSGVHTAAFSGDDGHGGTGTASTEITVTDVVENLAPVLSAPLTETVDEGDNLSFAVTATDQDGDHVALSASSVPTGANFSDNGNNTGAFSWTPGSDQSGVYTVTFSGDDGNGGTGTANTTITVMDVGGGGGGEVPGKACLIASFKSRDGATCFRIRPVDRSFDVRDVVLSSITFVFHGASVPVLSDRAHIELQCHSGGGGHDDAASLHLGDRHGDDQGEDDDDDNDHQDCGGVVCGEHGGNNPHGGHDGGVCDTLGIRACFSTQALLEVLHGAKMPCDLVHAEIHATLTNGAMVVATFGKHHQHDGDDDGDDVADGDKGKDHDGDKDKRHGMNPKCRPNPLNPSTELVFTTSREGRVRVTVYDMQGRLVKSLLDGFRGTGEQSVRWDGSSSRGLKVASGVYYFRIQAEEGETIQRVAVVK
jgi:putative Ig domain-containing protein/flagellar hook capping protein FlgD/Big-like domain-containing protein